MVTADVCKQDHPVVACHHTRRQAPLATLLRGEGWETGTGPGGAPVDLLEREALLACRRNIRFDAAAPGCTSETSAPQVDRLPLRSRPPSFLPYSDVLSPRTAKTARPSFLSGSLSKVSTMTHPMFDLYDRIFPAVLGPFLASETVRTSSEVDTSCRQAPGLANPVTPIIPCHRHFLSLLSIRLWSFYYPPFICGTIASTLFYQHHKAYCPAHPRMFSALNLKTTTAVVSIPSTVSFTTTTSTRFPNLTNRSFHSFPTLYTDKPFRLQSSPASVLTRPGRLAGSTSSWVFQLFSPFFFWPGAS